MGRAGELPNQAAGVADTAGRRRAFLIGLAGFAAASAAGGAAPGFGALNAARAVQGACAALLAPTALSLLAVTFTEARERARAFAVFGAIDQAATKELDKVDFDVRLRELVRIRASALNGCAYCIDMHTKDAKAASKTEQRIYALPAWRETPFFTARERAALALTESVTLMPRRACRTRTSRRPPSSSARPNSAP
ncbi:MAG: MFS transporter [Streptosporangiaceae bacterium]